MIKVLKTTENGLVPIQEIEKKCWINVSNPSPDELKNLSATLNIPLDFLIDSLDIDESSRVEIEDNNILIIFRASRYDKEMVDVPYTTLPIGIVISRDIVITVCSTDVVELLDLCNGKVKNLFNNNRNRFILDLLHRAAFFYLKHLKEINKRTNNIETALHRATKNEELIKLLNIEKSLVFFTTSLRSNELMMERLQKIRSIELNDDDKDFLEDVIIDNRKAIEMANVYSNILSGMMDAFASVISNNLNIVMKFLTSVTIILMIPTLIASIYGMNINLPFQHLNNAFFITIGLSFSLSIIGVLIFLKKRWL